MFLVHLVRHKWSASMPYPGYKKIATRMGISPTAARGHARKLEKKGLLKRVERIGTTSRFDLTPLFNALEKLQIEINSGKVQRAATAEEEEIQF